LKLEILASEGITLKKQTIIIIALILLALTTTTYSSSIDKPTTILTIATIIFAAISANISAESAEKAQKQTEETIKKADIENRLRYFYYPLKDYLKKELYYKSDEEALENIALNRYLAEGETIELFKKFREDRKPNTCDPHKEELCKKIDIDILTLEGQLKIYFNYSADNNKSNDIDFDGIDESENSQMNNEKT